MLTFFTNSASKYAYLRTFKGANFMILHTPVGKGYQNEEDFEICTFYIAKITNL